MDQVEILFKISIEHSIKPYYANAIIIYFRLLANEIE